MATRISFGPDQIIESERSSMRMNMLGPRKDGLLVQEAAAEVAADLAAATDVWPTFTLANGEAPVTVNPALVRYISEEN
jgi:hypothetical protein